jgi:hypothetical protein
MQIPAAPPITTVTPLAMATVRGWLTRQQGTVALILALVAALAVFAVGRGIASWQSHMQTPRVRQVVRWPGR